MAFYCLKPVIGVISCLSGIFQGPGMALQTRVLRRKKYWLYQNSYVENYNSRYLTRCAMFELLTPCIAASARLEKCDYVVTRNTKDFKKSVVPSKTPTELLEILSFG